MDPIEPSSQPHQGVPPAEPSLTESGATTAEIGVTETEATAAPAADGRNPAGGDQSARPTVSEPAAPPVPAGATAEDASAAEAQPEPSSDTSQVESIAEDTGNTAAPGTDTASDPAADAPTDSEAAAADTPAATTTITTDANTTITTDADTSPDTATDTDAAATDTAAADSDGTGEADSTAEPGPDTEAAGAAEVAPDGNGQSPDAPVAPARVITSSGAPGGPVTSPVGGLPDHGIIPPPPGSGSGAATAPVPTLGEIRGLRSGQIIEGRVTQVDANEVVLEMDDGTAGVIGKRHLSANGQTVPTELLSVGDRVEAAVLVRDDPKGRLVLSRAWALKQRAWELVETAKSTNKPITGRVTGLVKGGLVVDVGTRAFLPASQIDIQHVEDLASFVGQDIEALVHEADRVNDKVVLSRRNLLRQAQRAKANEVVSTLAPGQVHRGRVSLLTDFGAFVEIGGVRGLVHLSEISWSRVDRAADVLSPGDEVDVKVLAIKPGKKLSLSIRALSQDPLAGLELGQVLTGIVTRLADFGAFVRVGEGAEGLVHVTELAEYRVHAPEEVVTPGDEVLVKVLRIDRKRRRLDLSVNQAILS